MNEASKAFYSLSHEQQRAETLALSEVFLAYLDAMAFDAPSCDLPGHHAELIAEIRKQRADNARLRALVKDSEWYAGDREHWCQWCGDAYGDAAHVVRPKDGHAPTCPAFTPDGVVK